MLNDTCKLYREKAYITRWLLNSNVNVSHVDMIVIMMLLDHTN